MVSILPILLIRSKYQKLERSTILLLLIKIQCATVRPTQLQSKMTLICYERV